MSQEHGARCQRSSNPNGRRLPRLCRLPAWRHLRLRRSRKDDDRPGRMRTNIDATQVRNPCKKRSSIWPGNWPQARRHLLEDATRHAMAEQRPLAEVLAASPEVAQAGMNPTALKRLLDAQEYLGSAKKVSASVCWRLCPDSSKSETRRCLFATNRTRLFYRLEGREGRFASGRGLDCYRPLRSRGPSGPRPASLFPSVAFRHAAMVRRTFLPAITPLNKTLARMCWHSSRR